MTKEEKAEYDKKWREANKEKVKAYKKAYKEKNKEKIAAQKKAWNKANSEKMAGYAKSRKDGYYTVYYLKEEHYAGMTSRLYYRLASHKSTYNRHIEDVEIIGKYETKAEGLRVEAALHSMGYLGRHPRKTQQTLKQLL